MVKRVEVVQYFMGDANRAARDFEPTDETVTRAIQDPAALVQTIVTALSDARNVDPLELDPLEHYVDTDAVKAICRHRGRPDVDSSFTLSFHVERAEVTIVDGTRIVVEPQPASD